MCCTRDNFRGWVVQGENMRLFAFVMALLGVFIYLLFHFSFWAAFGAMYMAGMVVVALIAALGKHQASSRMAWDEAPETGQVK